MGYPYFSQGQLARFQWDTLVNKITENLNTLEWHLGLEQTKLWSQVAGTTRVFCWRTLNTWELQDRIDIVRQQMGFDVFQWTAVLANYTFSGRYMSAADLAEVARAVGVPLTASERWSNERRYRNIEGFYRYAFYHEEIEYAGEAVYNGTTTKMYRIKRIYDEPGGSYDYNSDPYFIRWNSFPVGDGYQLEKIENDLDSFNECEISGNLKQTEKIGTAGNTFIKYEIDDLYLSQDEYDTQLYIKAQSVENIATKRQEITDFYFRPDENYPHLYWNGTTDKKISESGLDLPDFRVITRLTIPDDGDVISGNTDDPELNFIKSVSSDEQHITIIDKPEGQSYLLYGVEFTPTDFLQDVDIDFPASYYYTYWASGGNEADRHRIRNFIKWDGRYIVSDLFAWCAGRK